MQFIEEEIECPKCKFIYPLKASFLENGEIVIGKLNGININCYKKEKRNGQLLVTARCPKCNYELDIILEEK